VDSNYPTILLSHSPEVFDEASIREVDLILSGHTHGGQLFITRYLRKIFPFDPALEFLDGFFQKGRATMYVSRGLGTSYLPFRFGVNPEITFFTFTGSQRYASLGQELSVSNNPPEHFSGITVRN
jgi:predicted MPP superfamily phosphohydrolase